MQKNDIQEVIGSIPLISTNARVWAKKDSSNGFVMAIQMWPDMEQERMLIYAFKMGMGFV